MTTPTARYLWQLLEPYHALTYFAPESHRAYEEVGLRGFWRGYFAGRAAPLGPVGAGVVTACFYGFHPDFVARAVPAVWSMISPSAAVECRLAGAQTAIGRILAGDDPAPLAAAAEVLRPAVERCTAAGRVLFAANRELAWPDRHELALWHAATIVREHRGDGHVAALVAAGIGPCEAHVLRLAADGSPPESIRPYRGWDDDDWAAANERLRVRGWLDEQGHATGRGRDAHAEVEARTDEVAGELARHVRDEDLSQLAAVLAPLVRRIATTGSVPYPNPIGVPPLDGGDGSG
jgi:hypothetical protein